ncbi:MAG: retropepsin-like aspartic protease [Gemmatimonadaceae bacterium]
MTRILVWGSARKAFTGVFLAAGVACASKPIEVETPAIVMLDTASRPALRMRKPAPAKNFWTAMVNLDPDYPLAHPTTSDERQFAVAMGMAMAGEADEAELLLDSLRRHTGDPLVRSASRILLTAMLQYQDKWKDLAELAPMRSIELGSTERDPAGVELWASAFKGVRSREMVFPDGPVILPLTLSVAATPVIPIEINGKQKLFWLDTGSSMSIVASDVAAECGVEALVSDTLEVATTTGRVPARPAAIKRLQIGGISITNSTAMIVSSELMQVRIAEANSTAAAKKIDGIIGFDIISRLNVRIDYLNSTVRLTKSVKQVGRSPTRNLFWVGTPIIRLIAPGGIPIHFGLDTGAQETYATERILGKFRVPTFLGERQLVGGFAGTKKFRGRFIRGIRLSLGGRNLLFQKLLIFAPAAASVVSLDGVLGSDVGRTGVVLIDAANGVFSIETPTYHR